MEGMATSKTTTPPTIEKRAEIFPEELPMENDFEFVEYYYWIIIVTGTPGIEKSVFFGYFLQALQIKTLRNHHNRFVFEDIGIDTSRRISR
ncbi:hypothetical protein F442_03517 [Phytophthora nicotianae P10297]|uniref:Uncharacterized protein n=1 Tax=Phytophthora nicotianae P10297 TaxID=1317064 RepID=W2ZVI1_PHYNI|nr:hypothetical protein F442_03517 [Phytophthora nicotianae P10297]